MREWQLTCKELEHSRISVNLSAVQLQQANLVDIVRSALDESGLAPSHLCLELTESTFFADPEAATQTLHKLKALGVQLELDDFGTGYSSLSCLGKLPLDGLKIDHTFTAKLDKNNDDAVVRSILDLAARLNFHVVAEGVETEAQSTLLADLGCKIGQGYHYARPMPSAGMKAYLEQRRGKTGDRETPRSPFSEQH